MPYSTNSPNGLQSAYSFLEQMQQQPQAQSGVAATIMSEAAVELGTADQATAGVLDLAPGSVGDVVTVLTTETTDLHGFSFAATGDGVFRLLVGMTTVAVARANVLSQSGLVVLPQPLRVASGVTVRLFVTAAGLATATYEGTVLHG